LLGVKASLQAIPLQRAGEIFLMKKGGDFFWVGMIGVGEEALGAEGGVR
jgi:hypothetical protein